jgi:hypothetical protein
MDGFGLTAIVRGVAVHFVSMLRSAVQVLVKSVPLLLLFSLVMFFTMEIWQVFTATGERRYWAAIAMFVVLGTVFLGAGIPSTVREVEARSSVDDASLRRSERFTLAAVGFISQALQVVLVSAAVWLFYVVLGSLLVSVDVRDSWIGDPGRTLVEVPFFSERLQVTYELVRVANGVAAFAGLYYAVTILRDSEYREQVVDALSEQFREKLARRSENHGLLARQHTPAVPPVDGSND